MYTNPETLEFSALVQRILKFDKSFAMVEFLMIHIGTILVKYDEMMKGMKKF